MTRRSSASGKRKWVELILHAAGWTLFLILPYMLRGNRNDHLMPKRLPDEVNGQLDHLSYLHYEPLIFNFLMIPIFYLNMAYIVPRFFLKRRYVEFSVIQLCIIAVLYFVQKYIHHLLVPDMPGMPIGIPPFLYMLVTLFAVCYCLVRQNQQNEQKQKERENENLKSELLFLRWQISPHFMFNVLNNMVALSRVKSHKLEPMLIRLSTLMRYMLYDTDEKKVPIVKEIEYLQSYIELQCIRFGQELQLTTNIQVQDNADISIEPMLLVPFVENAFKHGTGTIEYPSIALDMNVTQNQLSFSIKNKYMAGPNTDADQTHGIGLANVRRRLNLLYANNFTLETHKDGDLFIVSLNIRFS